MTFRSPDVFFALAPDPMCVIDFEGRFRHVNSAFRACLGYAEDEVVGKPVSEFARPTDRAGGELGRVPGRSLHRHLDRNGAAKWLSWSVVIDGECAYAVGRDVTDDRKAELREKANGFRRAAEAMPQIVWATDAEGSPNFYNRRWYEYTGLPAEEIDREGWARVVHPADLEAMTREWARALRTGEGLEVEFRLRNGRDGTYRWHLARAVPLRGDDGRIEKWLGTSIDIDYQIRIHEELRQTFIELKNRTEERGALLSREKHAQEASRLKSEFLANMSHEIRTPLNGLTGTARLLMGTRLSPKQKDLVGTLVQSAETLLAIVNDILDFSKIEAGRLDIELVDFELDALVRGVMREALHAAETKKIELLLDYPESSPRVFRGDPVRIRQVLANLVNNAVKFTRYGSARVSVRFIEGGDDATTIRFEVSDTGIGIARAALERIFETFVQADATTTRRYGGTGLGLSICKRLVGLMGGKIDVRSVLGEGSTFGFEIPLVARSLPASGGPDAPTAASPIRRSAILVAEDHPMNQKVIRYLLENQGHTVEIVPSGHAAIEAIRARAFDLVFMDCHMPDMDGYAAVREIRAGAEARFATLPIVALTADVLSGTRERCFAAGMNDYVCKPIDVVKLESVLRKHLGTEAISDAAPVAILDAEALGKLAGLDSLLGELISDFRELTPGRIGKIRAAASSRDHAALEEEAHALKSVAAMLGATELAAACEAMETAGRQYQSEGLADGVERIAASFAAAERALVAWSDAAA